MEAGRELDALVAEKVMGLSLDYEFADYLGAPTCRELREPLDEWGILPSYSTDIRDAWQTRDKIGEMHMISIQNETSGGSTCFIRHKGEDHYISVEYADTAPLAICLAALKAVGVKVEA